MKWRDVEVLPDGRRRVTLRDPRERDGELLWEARYPEAEVEKLEAALLSFAPAQLQQNPVAREGGIFKEEWLKFWSPGGQVPGTVSVPAVGTDLQSWDCAFKGDEASDPSCGGVLRRAGGKFYVLDCEWGRWDFPGLLEAVRRLSRRWPRVIKKCVEAKANGPAVISSLQAELPGFDPVEPEGGKEARANAVAPLFAAGAFYLPHPSTASWVPAAINELVRFPRGRHDDFVDMVTQGLMKLYVGSNPLADVMAAAARDPAVRRLIGR